MYHCRPDKADAVGTNGNRVKVENPDEFLEAFKSARFVKDPGCKERTEAEYVFYSGESGVLR